MNVLKIVLVVAALVVALAGCSATASTMAPSTAATTTAASSTSPIPASSSTPAQTSPTVTSSTGTSTTVTSTTVNVTTDTGVATTTATTSPSSGNASTGESVVINNIHFKGEAASGEANEYVEIQNWQETPVDITGWVLKNVDSGVTFTFPSYTLKEYQTVRVYTNEVHPSWGNFSFDHEGEIWDNKNGNTAVLYDAQGREISRRTY